MQHGLEPDFGLAAQVQAFGGSLPNLRLSGYGDLRHVQSAMAVH